MIIENNIIKYYLKNVMFITGTAYAGKSTMASLLSKQYGLILCGENYHERIANRVAKPDIQPNLCYFKTMKDWQEFVNRTPYDYNNWVQGIAKEATGFEITQLISASHSHKVIVDTNIPIDILSQIADYNQIAVMLSPQSMSVEQFFNRDDPEKVFLKEQIEKSKNPERTMKNFKACIAKVNSEEHYRQYADSGYFTLVRDPEHDLPKEKVLKLLVDHFNLEDNDKILISTEHLYIRPEKEIDIHSWYNNTDRLLNVYLKDTDELIGDISVDHLYQSNAPVIKCNIPKSIYYKEAIKSTSLWVKAHFYND